MQIQFYKALWGMTESVREAVPRILAAGYTGIEAPLGQVKEAREAGYTGLAIAMLYGEDPKVLAKQLEECAAARVTKVTVHAGKEHWSFESGQKFFAELLPKVKESGLQVNFETHRGRLLFDPSSTYRYLNAFESLTLCSDLSHWTVVCGNYLGEYGEILTKVAERTRHIHARVGYSEGPQVPDPRAKMWQPSVDRFFEFWALMRTAAEGRGESVLTIDPEFGPPHYMATNPNTGEPIVDLFEICTWMKDEIRRRWKLN
jgi:hypothetical protein